MTKHAILLSISTLVALSACTKAYVSTPMQQNGTQTGNLLNSAGNLQHQEKFTFKIANLSVKSTGADSEAFTVDGHAVRFKSKQMAISLDSDSELPAILKTYHASVLKQEIIPGRPIIQGSKSGGTYKQLPAGTESRLPNYLLSLDADSSDSSSELPTLAQQFGLRGSYTFSSEHQAAFFAKSLRIAHDLESGGRKSSLNYVTDNCSSLEGSAEGAPSPTETCPDDNMFWWTAPSQYGTYGCDLEEDPADGNDDLANHEPSGGTNLSIAVVDGGFEGSNESYMPPQIVSMNEETYNFVDSSYSIQGAQNVDAYARWHGREVSSVIFARWADSAGTVGSYPNALPILMNTDNSSWEHGSAIDTAVSWGARVINLSYGSNNPTPDWSYNAIVNAYNSGVVLIAGAGNDGDEDFYPASYSQVIGVGAYNWYGNLSHWGTQRSNSLSSVVDIYAPGGGWGIPGEQDSVVAVAPSPGVDSNRTHGSGGTSMAAPIVSGVALALIANGKASNTDTVWERLVNYSYSYPVGRALDALGTVLRP
ncbi:MAG TPA: S8/S53 family peptidase [Oscillatoriaceae cyanobacterium]